MKGVIRAKGHCPVCEGAFTEVKKLGFICPTDKTTPQRFFIEYAEAFFKSTDIRDLRKLDIINYLEHLKNNYRFSGKTIKNILDHFKTFLRYATNELEIINTIPKFPKVEYCQRTG